MLLSHLSFIVMCYDICKRCGAPHDDGTADYCMQCLDEQFNEAVDEAFIEELVEQGVSC